MRSIMIILLLSASVTFANSDNSSYPLELKTSFYKSLYADISEVPNVNNAYMVVDCTFRENVINADGTISNYIVTVHDVSWWNCKKMQLAVWWHRTF